MTTFIFITIILFASILQTSTGFCFSIMATPFLLMIFNPMEAIQINIVLSLVISSALIAKIRKDVDTDLLKKLIIGSLSGLPIGIILFISADINKLKTGIGIVLLLLTLLLVLNLRIKRTKRGDFFVGGLSGTLTTGIGMPGPPILLYFAGTAMQKETLRATTLAFYLFIYSVSLLIQVLFVGTNKGIWTSIGMALPLVFTGMYLGQLLFRHISQKTFRIFTYGILLFTGVYLLIK
ncbi:sulfite exporter TauE/SafE family protein [Sporosarcina sp. E16_8]|uniref:TSUP family transporter n=1 Tax=Sporosarcina sp. E16_8 TaxID=2789295 RepID=UPI001A922591|nr:sulfite exporter TauE/SafE family protein [Sporosarcina sp. E16_8]